MDTRIGKLAGALIVTMTGALAMGIASVTINAATGFEPDYFPYARAFLAPLTAGYILLLLAVVIFIGTMTLGVLGALLHLFRTGFEDAISGAKDRLPREVSLQMLRLFAVICFFSIVTNAWNGSQRRYESSLERIAARFVYTFELYPKGRCALASEERVRTAGSNEVMVGVERAGKLAFFKRTCGSPP